jgi:hypothetical protein
MNVEELISQRPFDRFVNTEVTRKTYWNRNVERWLEAHQTAWSGLDYDAHATIGAWDFENAIKDRDDPVFVPWYMIDIDESDPAQSLYHAKLITARLLNMKMNGLTISYTGNRGFHIAIPAGNFGNPVFIDTKIARVAILYLLENLVGDSPFDSGLASPLHLLRLAGSLRENGRRKVPLSVGELLSDIPERIIRGYEHKRSVPFVDPRTISVSTTALTLFRVSLRQAAEEIERHNLLKERYRGSGQVKPFIQRLLKKVIHEGDKVSKGITGRNKTAYVISCALFESGRNEDEVMGIIFDWNEKYVRPPLYDREIKLIVQSASKTFETI